MHSQVNNDALIYMLQDVLTDITVSVRKLTRDDIGVDIKGAYVHRVGSLHVIITYGTMSHKWLTFLYLALYSLMCLAHEHIIISVHVCI